MTIERTYICSHGEQVDEIALRLLGNEKYAADILAVNPGIRVSDGMCFLGGEVINIPLVNDGESDEDDAPWR